ncbi:hypothetical protein JQ615_21190 [Bradyrhizobium jicamae]|uniref:Uncharacterized protein n=1 Tax=Bradyrhizobium jicamae TaxID=280332 RepID=A0ABS5FMA2_9BRAD|nr:hypothetical protein [Bradyrhizobium jicamae]MBR0797907.1 hypothetical protein [Bradyrhizobium jicamae]MBR0931921.1 hypothetical protein [Bradyrhizobium jicamae]
MFEKLAKFRPFEPRRVTPRAAVYSNDNLPGFRRPERRRRRAPACHWILIDGRLECRWTVDDASGDLDHQRHAGRRSGPRATTGGPAVVKITASAIAKSGLAATAVRQCAAEDEAGRRVAQPS